jgi:hypothetical protein
MTSITQLILTLLILLIGLTNLDQNKQIKILNKTVISLQSAVLDLQEIEKKRLKIK